MQRRRWITWDSVGRQFVDTYLTRWRGEEGGWVGGEGWGGGEGGEEDWERGGGELGVTRLTCHKVIYERVLIKKLK